MEKLNVLYISNQGGGAPCSLLNLINSVKDWVNPIVLFENDWEDYQRFVNSGIECIIVPFRMNMVLNEQSYRTLKWRIHRFLDEYLKNRCAASKVAKQLSGRNIDIVHCNTGAITIGNEVAEVLHAKFVWHLREFQDIDFGGFPYHGWDDFYQRMRYTNAVIGISRAVGLHFHFDQHPNAHVLWDAVRSSKDASIIEEKENYILYCSGSIVPAKGLHDLLEAYGTSLLPQNSVRLVVIGKLFEDYRPVLDKIICQYHLENLVNFVGLQENVRPFFEKSKAFVLPSLNEGLGRVAIESMFFGCPVIARNAGGPTEYIEHEKNGYLFSSIEELKNLLNTVCLENQSRLIKESQTFAIDHFSEEKYGQEIMSIYQSICMQ